MDTAVEATTPPPVRSSAVWLHRQSGGTGSAPATPPREHTTSRITLSTLRHEELLIQSQQQVRDLLPFKERALQLQSDALLAQDRVKQKDAEIDALQALLRRERMKSDSDASDLDLRRGAEAAQLRDELIRANKRADAARDEASGLAAKLQTLEAVNASLRAAAEAEGERWSRTAAEASQKIQQLEQALRHASRREDELREVSEKHLDCEKRLIESLGAHEALKRKHHELQLEVTALLTNKNALIQQAQALEDQLRELRPLRGIAEQHRALEHELPALRQEVDDAQQALSLERGRRRDAEAREASLVRRVASLEEELHVAVSERAAQAAELKELRVARHDLVQALRDLTLERDAVAGLRQELGQAHDAARHMEHASRLLLDELAQDADVIARSATDAVEVPTSNSPGRGLRHPFATPDARHAANLSGVSSVARTMLQSHLHGDVNVSARVLHSHIAAAATREPSQSRVAPGESLGSLRVAVDRLTSALRSQRAANIELLRVEADCRGTIADLESQLRQTAYTASQSAMEVSKGEMDARRMREDVEDANAAARRLKREFAAFAARMLALCQRAVATAPAVAAEDRILSSATFSQQAEADEDPQVVAARAERLLAQTVEASAALRNDNGRLAAQVDSQAKDFAATRLRLVEEARNQAQEHHAAHEDAMRAHAALKESLSRAVVRHDQTTAELAGVAHDLTRCRGDLEDALRREENANSARDAAQQRVALLERECAEHRDAIRVAKERALDAERARDDAAASTRRACEQRDAIRIMLACAVAAVSRLRCDVNELLLQRRLMSGWARELEQALAGVEAACCGPTTGAQDSPGDDPIADRRVATRHLAGYRRSKGMSRFRAVTVAILAAHRLRHLVPAHSAYTQSPTSRSPSPFSDSTDAVTPHRPRRSRFRPTTRRHGVRGTVITNMALAARSVPVPGVDDLLACVSVDGAAVADAVVEKLLVCFASSQWLTVPPPEGFGPSGNQLTLQLASPERRRPDPRLLTQLLGSELDLTLLRRLAAGLCAVPASGAITSPLNLARHVCTTVRETVRRLATTVSDYDRKVAALSKHNEALRTSLAEVEQRAAEYARKLSDNLVAAKETAQSAAMSAASVKHQQTVAVEAAAAAERRRTEEAIAELAQREAAMRDERFRLEAEQKAAAALREARLGRTLAAGRASPLISRSMSRRSSNASDAAAGAAVAPPPAAAGPSAARPRSSERRAPSPRGPRHWANPTYSSAARRSGTPADVGATSAMLQADTSNPLSFSVSHHNRSAVAPPPPARLVDDSDVRSPVVPLRAGLNAAAWTAQQRGGLDTDVLRLLSSLDQQLGDALSTSRR
jgi:hypothetical protein